MELFIAGGCGEHGRNCFYVEQNGEAFLVDCGLLAGAEDNLPRLNAEQIQKLRAVFLTHSHADHTGALPWLAQQGYQGSIYATLPTLTQLPFSLNHIRALESLCPCKTFGTVPELSGLQVTWGRSGHCAGSVWLRFEWDEKSILFSGDYAEHSPLYPCDPLRSQTADLAVLDAAYGSTDADWNTCVKKLCVETVQCLKQTQLLFFPVPKYGRGPEILLLLKRFAPNLKFYGDAHFLRQVQQIQLGGPWLLPVPPHFADGCFSQPGKRRCLSQRPAADRKSRAACTRNGRAWGTRHYDRDPGCRQPECRNAGEGTDALPAVPGASGCKAVPGACGKESIWPGDPISQSRD